MKFKKSIITVVLLLAAGGAGYAYWRMGNGPKEPPYLTAPVSKGQHSPSGRRPPARCRR